MKSPIQHPAHSLGFLLSTLLLLWGCNPKAKNAGINKKTSTPPSSPSSSAPATPVSVPPRPPASEGQDVTTAGTGEQAAKKEGTGEQAAKKEEIVGQDVKARGVGAKDTITEEIGEQAAKKAAAERQDVKTKGTGGQDTTTEDTDEEVDLKKLLKEEFIEKFYNKDLKDALRKLRDGEIGINDAVEATAEMYTPSRCSERQSNCLNIEKIDWEVGAVGSEQPLHSEVGDEKLIKILKDAYGKVKQDKASDRDAPKARLSGSESTLSSVLEDLNTYYSELLPDEEEACDMSCTNATRSRKSSHWNKRSNH